MIIPLRGHIDSTNASMFEKEIRSALPEDGNGDVTLDASQLSYISSAGLRVLLRLKKEFGRLRVINVNSEVYEILEMTGFNQIFETRKALRQISIEGCPEIGRGAHGAVYRIAPDTIVKVYHPGEPMESIRRERELARWAFVRGIPTAIPLDIVQVGGQYGAVFELLEARSSVSYIKESPEHLEDYIRRSACLIRQLHTIAVKPGELPDMKEQMLEWTETLRKLSDGRPKAELTGPDIDRLEQMLRETPESKTLLHADLHLKNFLICGDELMLIDMDTLCAGDPIFDLATLYNSYREFPSIDPEAAAFLGIDVETCYKIFDGTMDCYLGETDAGERAEILRKARIFGCIRIINYMKDCPDPALRELVIGRCMQDIAAVL